MCDKKYVYNWQILLANPYRPSHNNNNKGLATNNVSRETIIVFPIPKNTLFCIDNKEDIT